MTVSLSIYIFLCPFHWWPLEEFSSRLLAEPPLHAAANSVKSDGLAGALSIIYLLSFP